VRLDSEKAALADLLKAEAEALLAQQLGRGGDAR
jgi:hypothetical protein